MKTTGKICFVRRLQNLCDSSECGVWNDVREEACYVTASSLSFGAGQARTEGLCWEVEIEEKIVK
jgi:hypothetical protein